MEQSKVKFYQKKVFWIVIVILIAAIAIGGKTASVRSGEKARRKALSEGVKTVEAERGSIASIVGGSGNLAAAENVDVLAPTGLKVKKVYVEAGDTVEKGDVLADVDPLSVLRCLTQIEDDIDSIDDALDNDGDLSKWKKEELKLSKEELLKYRDQMTALKENPVITAAANGIIESCALTEGEEIVRTQMEAGQNTSGNEADASSEDLSAIMGMASAGESRSAGNMTAAGGAETAVMLSADSGTGGIDASQGEVRISDFSKLKIETPKTGGIPQAEIEETESYQGSISWIPEDVPFRAGTVYTETAVLQAKSGYRFSDPSGTVHQDGWTYEVGADGQSLVVTAVFPQTEPAQMTDEGQKDPSGAVETPSAGSNGTADVPTAGSAGGLPSAGQGQNSLPSSAGSGGAVTDGTPSMDSASIGAAASGASSIGSPSVSAASGVDGSIISDTSGYYSNYETAVCVIRKQEKMKLVLSVDEQDILSVARGQSAEVTVDAIEGSSFTGKITEIADTAETTSGSAKYLVEIVLDADMNMRVGMSASARISVAEADNVLTIPMQALQQSGNQTFVYTGQNEDGTLSGKVDVATGVSDGEYVEITEGLSEGDVVYYLHSEDASGNPFEENNPFPDQDGDDA